MPAADTIKKEARRQTFRGVVVSSKMKDTVVVEIARYVRHSKYGKYMNRRTRLFVHDPGNTKKEGEKVTIEACRPISKRKAFRISA